jgi:putative transport protein
VVATLVGVLVTVLLVKTIGSSSIDPLLLAGAYTGALTSSPGLGAALEATGANALVTIGYSVTYPFGVIAVVLFIQLAGSIFRIDLGKERSELNAILSDNRKPVVTGSSVSSVSFSLLSFAICITGGIMVGRIGIPLPYIGNFSLGTTGGALVVSLAFGAMGKIGPLTMRMDKGILSALRSLSLAYFFATVGLQAGPRVAETFADFGLLLICIGFFAALIAETVTFLVGRYLLRLNWILLAGAICGAMTSTPGLGAAIEATQSEDSGAGYGATYPFALLCMVLFTKLLISTF